MRSCCRRVGFGNSPRMVGRDVSQFYARRPHQAGDVMLEIRDLVVAYAGEHGEVRAVDRKRRDGMNFILIAEDIAEKTGGL